VGDSPSSPRVERSLHFSSHQRQASDHPVQVQDRQNAIGDPLPGLADARDEQVDAHAQRLKLTPGAKADGLVETGVQLRSELCALLHGALDFSPAPTSLDAEQAWRLLASAAAHRCTTLRSASTMRDTASGFQALVARSIHLKPRVPCTFCPQCTPSCTAAARSSR
jgi:hypothetical protein